MGGACTSTFKNHRYCEHDARPCAVIFLQARFSEEILQALTERQLLEKDSTWNPCNVIHTRTMALSVRWQQRFLAGLAGQDWPYGTGGFLANLRSGRRDGRVLANLRLNAYCIIESVGPPPPSGTAVARKAK